MLFNVVILLLVISSTRSQSNETRNLKFPPGFLFGAGSSAVQVEGAWNEDGKGEIGLEYSIHRNLTIIVDNSTPDVACDSYHLYRQDIPFVTMAGMNTYRFSLAWARLLPTGDPNNVNQIAVDYYNDLINEVLRHKLTPVVTIFHYDLPLNLTRLGGWANDYIVDHFVAYAEFVLRTFGDRVKHWLTINEINQLCFTGYGGASVPPATNMSGIADYLCARNSLIAHAKVYRLYQLMPGNIKDGGKMGFTVGYTHYSPYNNMSISDHFAADSAMEYEIGWILNPVFGSGDFPALVREGVDLRSRKEGRKVSRLPKLTSEEILLIKGSADFMGVNQYTGLFASFTDHCPGSRRLFSSDTDAYACRKPNYVTTPGSFMQVVPGSLRDALTQIREKYNNPLVLITENGYSDTLQENLLGDNPERESFFQSTISDVFESMEEGSNLMGYLIWSLLDSFEFLHGYTLKFGMVYVDFSNENRTRTPKPIINFLRNFADYGLNVTST